VNEYSWPADGDRLGKRVVEHWEETVAALPEGAAVTGRVIGRQPFGVFVEIAGVPDAIGLAEIITMPPGAPLPSVGATVQGNVIGHAAHNHQVRLRLIDRCDDAAAGERLSVVRRAGPADSSSDSLAGSAPASRRVADNGSPSPRQIAIISRDEY
jgi:exosome complex RNA-binding protein Csl4